MIEVTAAVIRQNNKLLICQRPQNKSCALLWEFPGGKIEFGETPEQCIIRECQEELGIEIIVHQKLTEINYDYPSRSIRLHFFLCTISTGEIQVQEHQAITWITPKEIPEFEFCPADAKMLSTIDHFQLLE